LVIVQVSTKQGKRREEDEEERGKEGRKREKFGRWGD
jgi:hypothetical protein